MPSHPTFCSDSLPGSRPPPPVHLIPNEALHLIFKFLCLDHKEDRESHIVSKTHPTCIPKIFPHAGLAVSHVCRLWREAALSIPQLWDTVVFRSGEPFRYQQEFLKRVRHARAFVFVDFSAGWGLGQAVRILERIPPVTSMNLTVHLRYGDERMQFCLPHLLTKRAVNITHLQVFALHRVHNPRMDMTPPPSSISQWAEEGTLEQSNYGTLNYPPSMDIFHEILSGVECLALWEHHFSWHTAGYQRLRHLWLHFEHEYLGDDGLDAPTLMTIIRACPVLEVLGLRGLECPWSDPYVAEEVTRRIPLPNLRHLFLIQLDAPLVNFVLAAFDFPGLELLSLCPRLHERSIPTFNTAAWLRDIAQHLTRNSPQHLKFLIWDGAALPVGDDLRSMVASTPSIAQVLFKGIDTRRLLDLLVANPNLWPDLEEVTFFTKADHDVWWIGPVLDLGHARPTYCRVRVEELGSTGGRRWQEIKEKVAIMSNVTFAGTVLPCAWDEIKKWRAIHGVGTLEEQGASGEQGGGELVQQLFFAEVLISVVG